jgi:hypothetical protein
VARIEGAVEPEIGPLWKNLPSFVGTRHNKIVKYEIP